MSENKNVKVDEEMKRQPAGKAERESRLSGQSGNTSKIPTMTNGLSLRNRGMR